jgi:hypothetical protein
MSTSQTFVKFECSDPSRLATEALLYVMTHDHGISVPTDALQLAEKVAVIGIARRDTHETTLAVVNRAIDVITATLRSRLKVEAESAKVIESVPPKPSERPGKAVQVKVPLPLIPPSGAAARPF